MELKKSIPGRGKRRRRRHIVGPHGWRGRQRSGHVEDALRLIISILTASSPVVCLPLPAPPCRRLLGAVGRARFWSQARVLTRTPLWTAIVIGASLLTSVGSMCFLWQGTGCGSRTHTKYLTCPPPTWPPGPLLSCLNQRRSLSLSVMWSWIPKSRPAWRSCRRGTARPRRSATSSPGPGQPCCCPVLVARCA